ncbi:signal peptide protein [Streptomyces sp. DT2A-34]|uniref:signal peptide protein n=1 Tax=Streptomyces sp. DT2A-34 TaxID=3051182 RepID=UPI00265C133E|nr:signal peptide protein [Streptomyces sp. DT2A-34]MDO0913290.1 signal peptide protein [Streptomyces sp. DT2A-34]
MSLKKIRPSVAALALMVALAGLATAGPAAAATSQTTTATSTALTSQTPAIPTEFVDLPTSTLVADDDGHEVTVTYRNASSADRTVAPQLLVESPDAGPFLDPSDIRVERRTATGCWEPVTLGTQTGTLFTDLTTAQRTLHAGGTLTEVYRITVLDPEAEGTVHPRVALYA